MRLLIWLYFEYRGILRAYRTGRKGKKWTSERLYTMESCVRYVKYDGKKGKIFICIQKKFAAKVHDKFVEVEGQRYGEHKRV